MLRAVSPEIKLPGCEADHSPPFSVEVQNNGAVSSLPHTSSRHGAKLIKHRDNF
jgi:hypothetical protein